MSRRQRKTGRILNIDKARFQRRTHGRVYDARIAWVSLALGSQKLGFNVTVVPPGKRAFPHHAHYANEEMFYVLEGGGSVRIGRRTFPIRQGDFISLPVGPEWAHQIINTSAAPLRYLAVSTMEPTDVALYPDSKKLGVYAGSPPGRGDVKGALRHYTRLQDGVDYWRDES